MKGLAASFHVPTAFCPGFLVAEGNRAIYAPRFSVSPGFESTRTRRVVKYPFEKKPWRRFVRGTDWTISARSKVADAVSRDADVDNINNVERGEEAVGEEEATDTTTVEIERRLVSGERVLQISKADFTVSSLLDKIRRRRLDLRPSYQRDYVWDKRTASKLIESVLLNIPLPTMFFHEKSQGRMEVVDGKQRLTSIWCFMEDGTFPDGSEFALSGLEVLDKLNGSKYTDLEDSLKESMAAWPSGQDGPRGGGCIGLKAPNPTAMQDFALNVHTISRHSDAEVVFEVFERLNMGSTQGQALHVGRDEFSLLQVPSATILNEQELRNCVFQGRYNNLLEELARHPDMLRVFRHDGPHKRMRDREFILRFFALRRSGIENFYLPVKNWLNNEMRRHQFLEEEDFVVMKFDFHRCLSLSVQVFGEHLFRLPRGLRHESDPNVCLWDTIMFGFLSYRDDSRVLSKKKVLTLALNDLLVYDAEFKNNLQSTPKALKIRTKKWLLVLREVLGPS